MVRIEDDDNVSSDVLLAENTKDRTVEIDCRIGNNFEVILKDIIVCIDVYSYFYDDVS